MNSFNLYLNDSEIKGVVFPFRFAELLDERLDEAYVDFYNRVEFYEPLTEARIEIRQDDKLADTLYFVVGNDNSVEYPAGSGIYKHSVYLIERTKLLDGIVCSSLTFTNTLARRMPNTIEEDTVTYESVMYSDYYTALQTSVTLNIKKNVYEGSEVNLPSAKTIAEKLIKKEYGTSGEVIERVNFDNGASLDSVYTTSVGISFDNMKHISFLYDDDVKFQARGRTIKINYFLVYNIIKLENEKETKVPHVSAITMTLDVYQYALRKWTITDCINRVLECAKPLFGSEKPVYRFEGVDYNENGEISSYTVGTQAEKYDKILAPEFSMTQCTLREQLKVIGSFIHAEPWLDEYNTIHFKSLGTTEKCSLQGKPYVYSGAKTDINQYCTEVRSYAQNIISDLDNGTNIKESLCSLRTETQYVRITEENGIVSTTQPIYSIKKVTCGIMKADMSGYFIFPVDITPYIFESTQYNANLSSYEGIYPYAKEYALYYTIGEKDIKGLFFKAPHEENSAVYSEFAISNILAATSGENISDIQKNLLTNFANLVFTVEYDSMFSSIVSHGKNYYESGKREYTQIYNQTENVVESKYYGENLKGIAVRLGNPEEERTYVLKNFSEIPETGQMLDGYAISAVNAEIMPYHIKCTVGLSKDFNRISEYVGISSIKRMYEVSERQVCNRDILIKDTLVIGSRPEEYKSPFMKSMTAFSEIFTDGETITKNEDGTTTTSKATRIIKAYATMKSKKESETSVLLPVSTSVFGNVATFTFSYKDNYSAGNKTEYKSENEGISGRWQTDVRYTDFYGRGYWLDFNLGSFTLLGNNFPFQNPELMRIPEYGYPPVVISNYRIRKDSRERISVTYELEAQSNDSNIIIGSEFMRLCRLVNDDLAKNIRLQIFEKDDIIDKFDLKYTGKHSPHPVVAKTSDIEKKEINDDNVEIKTKIGFSLSTDYNNKGYGWALISDFNNSSYKCQNEDGSVGEYVEKNGGKILILCTAKNTDPIKLDFFLTRK